MLDIVNKINGVSKQKLPKTIPPVKKSPPWPSDETLREMAKTMTGKAISLAIGKNIDSTYERMKKLGVKGKRPKPDYALSDATIIECRQLAKGGEKHCVLAKRYKVSQACMSQALTGTTFKHLNDIELPVPKRYGSSK